MQLNMCHTKGREAHSSRQGIPEQIQGWHQRSKKPCIGCNTGKAARLSPPHTFFVICCQFLVASKGKNDLTASAAIHKGTMHRWCPESLLVLAGCFKTTNFSSATQSQCMFIGF